jgi:arabinose-5-phosphate isomerase
MNESGLKRLGIAVVETERDAVDALLERIGEEFVGACESMLACTGRVVVTGMGKSGHIGSKIAATLASTGTPAFFMHPGEASHGDLGMLTRHDVVLALSNSGETDEITLLLPLIKRLGISLIALCGNRESTLGRAADFFIDVSISKEACPLGLAPTASTTVALVMGDALAIALLEARGFTQEDFALSHPGGSLGRRLLLRVKDIMHTGDRLPVVPLGASLSEALVEMSAKGLGMTAIVDQDGKVAGVYTDGDLRRTLDRGLDLHNTAIDAVMTRNCRTCRAEDIAAEELKRMEDSRINGMLVVDDNDRLIGAFNMHDLLRARVL